MRSITFVSLLVFGLICVSTKTDSVKTNKLNGTWIPLKQEIGGKELPKAVFEKQKLIISDSTYTVMAESVDIGIIKCKADKMDIYGKDGVNKGKHFTAIYKLEKEQLTICYNLSGDVYPEKFETKGKAMYFLSVFKKEKAK